jgi:hypothetical protein
MSKEQRESLLTQMKWLNTLRNKIVHYGQDVSPEESKKAIRITGLLLRMNWVQYRRVFFEKQGMGDLFKDFPEKIQAIKID